MKKTLLAGLLALAFTNTANATIVTITDSLTDADLTANVAFGYAIGNTSPIYLEFTSSETMGVDAYYTGTLPTSSTPLSYSIYLDEVAATGTAEINNVLTSMTLAAGETFSYNFIKDKNYVLKFSASSSPTALVTLSAVSAVPEASTYALMGFGFLGLAALRRRQKQV